MDEKIEPLRLVLDTGVLVSSLLFARERWNWLREGWIWQRIRPIVCKSTTLELIHVLKYPKFQLTLSERSSLLEEFLPFSEAVAEPQETEELAQCRDPKDQVFINLAWEQRADYLVSGDSDLLEYPSGKIRIVSPAELKKLMEAKPLG
ncbi:MAG: putative toxin-antitoxin system toxin component, PIN family [Spirochaetia bacterium]